MSEHVLPDDPARWPENPYELLGVPNDVSQRDLRRAYTRLLRMYKPEQFPEQFRRIRAAYEGILNFIEMFGSWKIVSSDSTASTPEEIAKPQEQEPSHVPPESEFIPPMPSLQSSQDGELQQNTSDLPHLSETLDRLWQQMLEGQEAVVYQQLIQIAQQHPQSIRVYQQLYWILRMMPHVDTQRSPCDWLVQGLTSTAWAGPLRELYREEIADHAEEAVNERMGQLLNHVPSEGMLADVLEWRWRALLRLRRWNLLEEDVQTWRLRVLRADEVSWLRLLLLLVNELAWIEEDAANRLLATCRQDISEHDNSASTMPWELDRLDVLMSLAPDWRILQKQRQIPTVFLDLIRLSWNRPFAEFQNHLNQVLEQMSQSPPTWLAMLDEIQQQASMTLVQLGQILNELQTRMEWIHPEVHPPERAAVLVRRFLDSQGPADYIHYRPQLLTFCLYQAIEPEQIAQYAEDRPACWPSNYVSLAQAITNDWPLRYLYKACQMFWA